jgi:CubicO group peptidase (beta-lactamase class C family)
MVDEFHEARHVVILEHELERYMRPYVDSGDFSGAVLLAEGDTVLACAAYGQANYEHGIPCRSSTRFHIASVSKPFTALAVVMLEQEGRLRRDDPIGRYLSKFPGGDWITLAHLLTHTSGISDINQAPFYVELSRSPQTPSALATRIRGWLSKQTQLAAIGTYRYSNSNYNLLAAIIEVVAQEEYGAYLRNRLFLPAGMTSTLHDGNAAALIPERAVGYIPSGRDGVQNAPFIDWSSKTGNGSLVSTVGDLHRFHCALASGALVPPAVFDEALAGGAGNRYGWFVRSTPRGRSLAANGRSPGFTASLERFAERDRCVVVLSNRYSTVSHSPIAGDLVCILCSERVEAPDLPPPADSTGEWTRFAGTYLGGSEFFVPDAALRVDAAPDHLVLRWGDQTLPLVPLGGSAFRDRLFWGHVRFEQGPAGTALIWTYDGREYRADQT